MEHILKWFTDKGDSNALAYVMWFANIFSPNDFNGIDSIMAAYLKYCADLSVVPCYRYLLSYLKIDGMKDVKRYNIKFDDMDSYDYDQLSQLMEAYEVIKQVTTSAYEQYMQEDLTGREFKVDMYEYMSSVKSERISQVLMKMLPKLTDGSDVNQLSDDIKYELTHIDEIYDVSSLDEIDTTVANIQEQKMEQITDTGIDAIDGDIGGIYSHLIYTLNAQPAGGKTRMALIHFIYRVMVKAKKDCGYYSTELTATQVKNILIAHHVAQLFGKKIPDSLMNKGELNAEQQKYYETAKADLFESGKYGQLIVKEECIVEKMKGEINAMCRANPNLKLICVDYMGLVESEPEGKYAKRLDGYEIITEAYKVIRRFVKTKNIAALCINQFNDKGIEAASTGKTIKSGYVQGGHIVNRHTDYDLCLTYTDEQKMGNIRTLQNTKTRGTEGFKPVTLRVDLSVSLFQQEKV